MTPDFRLIKTLCCNFLLLVFSNLAHADSQQKTTLDFFELSLEELLNIPITSQKRTEKIQETPLSVTALNSDQVDQWTITDFTQLAQQTPGLVIGRSGYDPRPAMRGARTQQVEANDAVVSVYHNGVYRPRHAQAMLPIVDIERIEIMRGPQGTLFGRNSFGGSINMIAQKPQLQDTEHNLAATVGDYDQRRLQGYTNIPVNTNSAIRISGVSEERDPFIENIVNASAGLRDKDTGFIRGQIYTELSELSSLLVSVHHWSENANGNGVFGYKLLGIPINPDTALTNPNAPLTPRIGRNNTCGGQCGRYGAGLDTDNINDIDTAETTLSNPYKISSDYVPTQKIHENMVTAEYNYHLNFADVKVLAANMNFEDFRLADTDFSRYSSVIDGYQLGSKTQTAELQFISNQDGSWKWVSGFYYLKEDLEYAYLWKDIIELANNLPDPAATPKNEWASWQNQLQLTTHSYAVFGQAQYSLTNALRATVGVRHTRDRREWDIVSQNPHNLEKIDFTLPLISDADHHWSANTWRAGIEQDLSQGSLLYATVSTGFLAGNFKNGDMSYDPQHVIAYEIGNKILHSNRKLRINTSLYHNNYSDLLATEFIDVGGSTQGTVSNAGAINAYGLEIEIDWFATSQLWFGIRGEFSKTEYGNFVTSNPFQEGGTTIKGVTNLFQLEGTKVMHSPDYAFSFLASHETPLGKRGKITPSLLLHISDDYRVSDEPYGFADQDNYVTLDANLTWTSPENQWQLKFYASNITNEAILVRGARFGGNIAAVDYADPRMFGLRISYSYDH